MVLLVLIAVFNGEVNCGLIVLFNGLIVILFVVLIAVFNGRLIVV